MFKYRFYILLFLFIFSNNTFAQQEMGLQSMNVWQSSRINPAFISENKLTVGLPSLHLNYYNNAGDFNALIVDYVNEEEKIDAGSTLENLAETGNILRGVLELETFNIGYRLGNIQLGFSHSQKTDLFMKYPKTLAKLFFEGNGQYIGQDVPLDHDIHLISYNEFGLSGAMKLAKFTIGARAKILTGIANANVTKERISLYTDPDIYQLELDADYELNVSSLGVANDLKNFNLSLATYEFNDFFTTNAGVAVDLGVTYEVNKKLTLAASVLDLGKINWTENVKNYSSQDTSRYEGFDFAQFSTDDSLTFNSALDTLQNVFNFEQTENGYSTTLPTKFYISASYQLNDKLRLGGLFYNEIYRGQSFPVFALSANAKLTNLLSVGGVYSGRKDSPFNLGLNFALKFEPVQVFATTDNIIAVFQPYKNSNVNLRAGVNLLF